VQGETVLQSVVIGNKAGEFMGTGAGINSSVIIGYQAGSQVGGNSQSNSVIIGYKASQNAALGGAAANNVFIGSNTGQVSNHSTNNNVCVGGNIALDTTAGTGGNTIIGVQGGSFTGTNNVFFGYNVPVATSGTEDSRFCIGSNSNALLFGQIDTGNLQVGKTIGDTGRDFATSGVTNALKLLNGTRGTGNPAGGGFFYVSSGVLHWVDSSGIDTTLSLNASGQLASSATAYTNNAAAQTATMTNGPLAGNPTKWIPINDNGTIRNIPAW
jgi:hypothetical protein